MQPYRERNAKVPAVTVRLEAPSFIDRFLRREPRSETRLCVEDGVLTVVFSGGSEPARFLLRDLIDVELETEEVDKGHAQLGPDARIAVGFSSLPVDMSRIVLVVGEDREGHRLSDAQIAHEVAMSWLGKIRLFLRAHGWVPEDERVVTSSR